MVALKSDVLRQKQLKSILVSTGQTLRISVVGFVLVVTSWTVAVAQDAAPQVMIDARAGAKVNVRAAPEVTANNIVGKALGGDVAAAIATELREPYTWYRIRALDGSFEGWVRGDLIEPLVATETAIDGLGQSDSSSIGSVAIDSVDPTPASSILRDPNVWTRDLGTYLEAVASCVETGSAQPAVAVDMRSLQRGLIEVDILDSAARRWKCVIREAGGTPLRFDPMSNVGATYKGPFFASADTGRPEMQSCDEIEPVSFSRDRGLAGWVIYTDCE